jgi:serine/threonine protein kinase
MPIFFRLRPPERIEGESKEAYGVQADVWSLGITLVLADFFKQ